MVNEDTLTYVTACLSAQALIHSLTTLEYKNSPLYKGRVKSNAENLLKALEKNLEKDISKLYSNDEIQAMKIVRAIEKIGVLVGKVDLRTLGMLDQILQKDFDFSKYKLVEI